MTFYQNIDVGHYGHVALWTADGYLVMASKNMLRTVGSYDPSVKQGFLTEIKTIASWRICGSSDRVAGPKPACVIDAENASG